MEEFCKDHTNLMSGVARIEEKVIAIDKRINGSIDDIHRHIASGQNWRGTIIGVGITLLLTIFSAVYAYGHLNARVCDNEQEVGRLRTP